MSHTDQPATENAADTAVTAEVDEHTIDTHLEAYGETDAVRRRELIARVWAEDGTLVDPPLDGRGHEGIDALAVAVQDLFPGHTFARTTAIDAHHGVARYGWELRDPQGATALAGIDVAESDRHGRLRRVVGFFGPLAPRS